MSRSGMPLVGVAVLVVLSARAADAAWTVDARGECVDAWHASDLLRGPAAIANGLVLPVRSAIGGFQLGHDDTRADWKSRILLLPMMTVAGGGMGFLEGLLWMGTGLVDTVTGGALEVAPLEATQPSLDPVTPRFAGTPRASTTDPCGRPTHR